jgi:hypothetical protein
MVDKPTKLCYRIRITNNRKGHKMRKRRRRFTGLKNNGEPVSILAYDYEGARETFWRHFGYEPWNLIEGKLKSDPRWEINPAGLKRALRELEIDWPVSIRRTDARGVLGRHRLKSRNGEVIRKHYISVNKHLSPEDAVRVLLHELRHAWQAEEAVYKAVANGDNAVLAWSYYEGREGSYREREMERDARNAEKRAGEFLDLTRWAR